MVRAVVEAVKSALLALEYRAETIESDTVDSEKVDFEKFELRKSHSEDVTTRPALFDRPPCHISKNTALSTHRRGALAALGRVARFQVEQCAKRLCLLSQDLVVLGSF